MLKMAKDKDAEPGHDAGGREDAAGREWGLLRLAAPLLERGRARFREEARRRFPHDEGLPFRVSSLDGLFLPHLLARLGPMAARTMVLELNVARVEGRLRGDTSRERYADFLGQLGEPGTAGAILREYPVLVRQLCRGVDFWLRNSLEFLERLCADWDEIRGHWAPERDPGPLAALQGGVGDPHRGGQSVMIAEFAAGFRLVYKPRSLSVDRHFHALLTWLNERGLRPALRIPRVLDRRPYGWAEHVAQAACESREEARRFYARLGAQLAVLYALEATDFHYENLIASGEHPALVDLETLFHPRFSSPLSAPAERFLAESVLRVGLLPYPPSLTGAAGGFGPGVELSGMRGGGDQMTPFGVLTLEGEGTDEMRFVRRPAPLRPGRNRPTLQGEALRAEDFEAEIRDGFAGAYRLLRAYRRELLASGGPIDAFAEDEVRVLVRATRTYAELLQESFHPDLLRGGLERDRWLDRLWFRAETRPELARLIPAEQADLRRGDIPLFTARPDSRCLWSSLDAPIDGVFARCGLDAVRARIAALSEEDLERQLQFIRRSLAPPAIVRGRAGAPAMGALLDAAREIGDWLAVTACREPRAGGGVAWVGLAVNRETAWEIAPVGRELYDGLPGIGLFLAALGDMTDNDDYRRLAREALLAADAQLRDACARQGAAAMRIGAFTGESGLLYALVHVGRLQQERTLIDRALQLADALRDAIPRDRALDLLSGAAGHLCVLCALYEQTGAAFVKDDLRAAAAHLLAHARRMPRGIGWATGGAASPLTGFSHGAAGIAYALLRAAQLLGDDALRLAAAQGFAYEQTQFLPEAGNWRDLRRPSPDAFSQEPRHAIAWCHGAPGIGLSRLLAWDLSPDEDVQHEIRIALQTTRRQGLGGSHCLCHGDFGNLELLLEASRRPAFAADADDLPAITSRLLREARETGWRCATPKGAPAPGLMLGLAGIGYGLLRLADPDRVPSILMLEAPRL